VSAPPPQPAMKLTDRAEICLRCVHFRNQPTYLEDNIKGLTTLGSAYGSVRKDDGICARHDLYLSAYDWCDTFTEA